MSWFCKKCGSENDEGEMSCVVCGSGKVGAVETPESVKVIDQQPDNIPAGNMEENNLGTPGTTPEQPKHGVVESAPEESSYLEIQFVQSPLDELIGKKVKLNLSVFPSVSVGRSPENVLQIPDPSVSRMHGKFMLEGKDFYFEDVGSSNGSYIFDGSKFNEAKEKTRIEEKTLIKLGEGTIVKITSLKSL
ncbi:MAG: FHA domain-containing protein [Thermoplasmataceae archaeon]